jgi:uncharacterized membrane protein YphA (DoxX/SURF4 family)
MSTDLEPALTPSQHSTLLRTVVFRFGFCYWVLFCIPIIATQIDGFEWLGNAIDGAWNSVAGWVGRAVLAIPYEINTATNGSGDRTIDWLIVLCFVSIALIATVVWTLVDRRPSDHARLREILRILVRYSLAFILLGYGVIKVFGGQFPVPGASRLFQRFGDSSPMGLLWTFMGASPAYVFFSGAMEVLGAVLLLFRRTTTIGALVLTGVLANIVLLNFCYDVPVKINSSHYFLMCIFLVLPDLQRLANVLLFNRSTEPVPHELVLPRRWMRVTRLVVKYGAIAVVMFTTVKSATERYQSGEGETWYGGYWAVTTFTRDGRDVPALATDSTRWQKIRFRDSRDKISARWTFMDDAYGALYKVSMDERSRSMVLTYNQEANDTIKPGAVPVFLTYTRIDADHLELEGKVARGQGRRTAARRPAHPHGCRKHAPDEPRVSLDQRSAL